MESKLAVFRNQEATALFNYLVSYTHLIAKNQPQNEETCRITLEVIPPEQKIVV